MPMLICPVCGKPLDNGEKTRRCPSGHAFDRAAKGGYIHLLRPGRKGSAVPGDSAEMCLMRTCFLEGGWYAPLRQAAAEAVRECAPRTLLDAGCGEGYYTEAMRAAQKESGGGEMAGIDLSKAALRQAGRRCPDVELAVASLFHLPLADRSCDMIVSLFAPLCPEEFTRVLRAQGTLLTVTPSARHLWGLKEVLYAAPYENDTAAPVLKGLKHVNRQTLDYEITLDRPEAIEALFRMTPYAWKTGREGAARLLARDRLQTAVSFLLDFYQFEQK